MAQHSSSNDLDRKVTGKPPVEDRPAGQLSWESSPDLALPGTAAALSDPRLAHPTSQSTRQQMVARYTAQFGNRATGLMLKRKEAAREAARKEVDEKVAGNVEDPIVTSTMNFGPHVQQPHWGAISPVKETNPFASRTLRQPPLAQAPGATADVQAADAEAGGVSFDVTSFSAAVAAGLTPTETAGGVSVSSQTYTASGTVKATGPKSRVANWDVGFLQTLFKSSVNFYYNSAARTKSSLIATTLPVRDGDPFKQPWYGLETVVPFAAAPSDTQTSSMDDTPGSGNFSWNDPVNGEADTLDHSDGEDVFRSWLAVKNRRDHHKKYLRFADWTLDYSTTVDTTQPVGSRVTPTGGATVTGTGNGMGGKQPSLFDPVANNVLKIVNTTW